MAEPAGEDCLAPNERDSVTGKEEVPRLDVFGIGAGGACAYGAAPGQVVIFPGAVNISLLRLTGFGHSCRNIASVMHEITAQLGTNR